MSRSSKNQYTPNGRLYNGYDYEYQAWVRDGVYVTCGHPVHMGCSCFGRIHAGEMPVGKISRKELEHLVFSEYAEIVNETK